MCDECTDYAWGEYHNLLDRVEAVVKRWAQGEHPNTTMFEIAEIVKKERNF